MYKSQVLKSSDERFKYNHAMYLCLIDVQTQFTKFKLLDPMQPL